MPVLLVMDSRGGGLQERFDIYEGLCGTRNCQVPYQDVDYIKSGTRSR